MGNQPHGNVNVFKDAARGDTKDPVTGFHQIVAFPATVLTAEVVGEGETGIELFGFDQESRTVSFPFNRFHGALTLMFCWNFVLKAISCLHETTFL